MTIYNGTLEGEKMQFKDPATFGHNPSVNIEGISFNEAILVGDGNRADVVLRNVDRGCPELIWAIGPTLMPDSDDVTIWRGRVNAPVLERHRRSVLNRLLNGLKMRTRGGRYV